MMFGIFAFIGLFIGAKMFDSSPSRIERSTSEQSFEEKLEEGYQLLKDERNAIDTKKLMEEFHGMEEKIKNELSSENDDDLSDEQKDHVEFKRNQTQPTDGTIAKMNENSKVAAVLFQGDMLLNKKQAEEVIEDVKLGAGERTKRQAYRNKTHSETLWKNGIVYYSFYSNTSTSARRVFEKATVAWAKDTCLEFLKNDAAADRIALIDGDGCFSDAGRIGGEQRLSIGQRCESVGQAAHEIGHALGLFHTQSRHDRSKFVRVLQKNIMDGFLTQFTKESRRRNYNYNLTYDNGSVMHYEGTAFLKNRRLTMIPHDVLYSETLGSDMISLYDKLMVNSLYKCLERCDEKSSANCDNGGFPNPNNCSRCVCPSGYGERLCRKKPSGCGNILNATSMFQTLTKTLGEKNVFFPKDDFKMCHFWINAPEGSRVEVVFDSFPPHFAIEGCVYGGVEIKTGHDKRLTGYRFCSPSSFGTTLISNHSTVPVIIYTRVAEATATLSYRISTT